MNNITSQLIKEAADKMFSGTRDKREKMSLFDDLLLENKIGNEKMKGDMICVNNAK